MSLERCPRAIGPERLAEQADPSLVVEGHCQKDEQLLISPER